MQKKVLKTVQMAMFAAISIVLVYLVHFPLIPSAPFLEYDMADVPILLSTLLLGTGEGIAVLFVAALIQALTVSASSGWIGFLMHFIATLVLIVVASLLFKKVFSKKLKSVPALIAGLVIASISMAAVMIPLNLVFTGIFMGTGVKTVASMLIPAIIPFNILKAGINSVIVFILYFPLKKVLAKYL